MARDKRYKNVKVLFAGGQIKTFNDIFDTLPRTLLAKDMGIHNYRFNKLMNNLFLLSLLEVSIIATLMDIDFWIVAHLIEEQHRINKKIDKGPTTSSMP